MIIWTFSELAHLTRKELGELDRMIREMAGHFEEGSVARTNALISLENIRRILMQRDLHP